MEINIQMNNLTAILSKYKILESHDYILSRWSTQQGDPQPVEPGFPSQFHGFGHLILDIEGTNLSGKILI